MVRRTVVVTFIHIMRRRGHRAYKHIDMQEVEAKAIALPKHDVLPEVIRLFPFDGVQDKTNAEYCDNRSNFHKC